LNSALYVTIGFGNTVNILFNPAVIGMTALFLAVLWMLRDEKDRTRPLLVIALVINLFYGWVLSFVMGRENGLVPWKYDYILLHLDDALGIPASAVAAMLQPAHLPLLVIYQLMVPMMIAWFLVARQGRNSGSIVVAYVAEMVAGPLLYTVVPACGPVYAFRAAWLHPPAVQATVVRLSGMPNAFPSLHTATALVFVSFARGRLWQTVSIIFLAGTIMATIATGEHYAIDLVAGLAFGCFAVNAGKRKAARSISFFALVLGWSLTVRLAHEFLIEHAVVLQVFVLLTVSAAIADVSKEWLTEHRSKPTTAETPAHASV
jgi:hypothetical protein